MTEKKTKDQKLAYLKHITTSENRFFHDYSPDIEMYLEDEDPDVRVQAIRCLWEYPDPFYIDVLINLAENDPNERVRQRAVSGLGRYIYEGEMAGYDFDWGTYNEIMHEDELPQADFERVRDYLLEIIENESQPLDMRRYAIEAISFCHEPEVLNIIEQAYRHPDKKMKISAIFAMGRNGNVRWGDYIVESLYSPDPDIEYEAVRAAGESHVDRANRQLMRIAEGAEDKDLRIAAIWSLGQIGHEMSFLLLDELRLFAWDPDIREIAEAALDEWMIFSQFSELDDDYLFGEDFDDLDDGDWLDLD